MFQKLNSFDSKKYKSNKKKKPKTKKKQTTKVQEYDFKINLNP